MPTGRTLSVRLTPELEAVVMQDAKDSALTISSVIRMRLKQRYDQMQNKAYVIPVHNYANDDNVEPSE